MFLPDKIKFLLMLCILGLLLFSRDVFGQAPQEVTSKHFIVQYSSTADSSWARDVLRESESYYNKIANQIGYRRYNNFWTWDQRVIITVYPNQAVFAKATGQPAWAKGAARRDNSLFHARSIVTYKQEEGFLDGILPHEIAHLIFRDFVGFETQIPLWFDEGVAQLQQKDVQDDIRRVVRQFVHAGQYIPFEKFQSVDIRYETDPYKVALFYGQSFSVVDFLLTKYGTFAFGRMCQELKEGKSFLSALNSAYSIYFSSLQDLEKKWLNSIQN